jgi:phage terminase large subunit-like protein
MTGAGYSGDGSPDRADALVWALTELMGEVEAPLPFFGYYGSGGGFNGAYWVDDPNASAGAVYASMPPEYWAAQGIFHKNDREYWIRKGVYVPPSEGQK